MTRWNSYGNIFCLSLFQRRNLWPAKFVKQCKYRKGDCKNKLKIASVTIFISYNQKEMKPYCNDSTTTELQTMEPSDCFSLIMPCACKTISSQLGKLSVCIWWMVYCKVDHCFCEWYKPSNAKHVICDSHKSTYIGTAPNKESDHKDMLCFVHPWIWLLVICDPSLTYQNEDQ
jgi:hypothetical protein